jgi:hypothetical protein
MLSQLLALSAVATLALAKTDYAGCTSSTTVVGGGASVVYWDPTNGEICQALDCGGGRAPPKTNVPGCGSYEGTETYSPSYLPGWSEATATSELYSTTIAASLTASFTASSELYSTTIAASYSAPDTPAVPTSELYSTTLSASLTRAPSGTGSSYPTGNGTKIESPTLSSTGSPTEQTGNGAGMVGAKQAVVGVVAGVFGLAML